MTDKKTGGPAFPCDIATRYQGASLRDYFAAKAMQAWLSSFGPDDRHPSSAGTLDMLATQAYAVADAMLEARND
ncbi:hypothetical protein ACNFCJ_21035 [Pseudomonas sp. NY15364]|uniref:hypothetical protein n=1 Tax=Pseudomonas sp. NY15364 TaxID=3400353 RepID=UPI003A89630F